MAAIRIPSESTEYLQIKVVSRNHVDLTAFDVFIAAPEVGADPEDWIEGTWEGDEARILIGPESDNDFGEGAYDIYVKVVAGAEEAVRDSGRLTIY